MEKYLRKCTTDDFDVLRELSIKTYYETFASLNTKEDMEAYLEDAFHAEGFNGELNDSNCEFFFLYCDEKIAGYLKLNEAPSQTDINDRDSLEIERIYVVSEFQGAGLGGFLMEQAIQKAIERNKKYVWLGVWEKMKKQSDFIESMHFMRLERTPL